MDRKQLQWMRTSMRNFAQEQHKHLRHLLSRSVVLPNLALRVSSRTQGEQRGTVLGHWDEKRNLTDWLSVKQM